MYIVYFKLLQYIPRKALVGETKTSGVPACWDSCMATTMRPSCRSKAYPGMPSAGPRLKPTVQAHEGHRWARACTTAALRLKRQRLSKPVSCIAP